MAFNDLTYSGYFNPHHIVPDSVPNSFFMYEVAHKNGEFYFSNAVSDDSEFYGTVIVCNELPIECLEGPCQAMDNMNNFNPDDAYTFQDLMLLEHVLNFDITFTRNGTRYSIYDELWNEVIIGRYTGYMVYGTHIDPNTIPRGWYHQELYASNACNKSVFIGTFITKEDISQVLIGEIWLKNGIKCYMDARNIPFSKIEAPKDNYPYLGSE